MPHVKLLVPSHKLSLNTAVCEVRTDAPHHRLLNQHVLFQPYMTISHINDCLVSLPMTPYQVKRLLSLLTIFSKI